jgi:hypothetical protein
MPAITVKGIRLDTVSIKRLVEEGRDLIDSAQYSLISSTDNVLARQVIKGYGGLDLEPSPATKKALEAFMASYKADVLAAIGLDLE